jgi:hypothetical protein
MNAEQVAAYQELTRQKAALEEWLDRHDWVWIPTVSRWLDQIVNMLDRNGRHG